MDQPCAMYHSTFHVDSRLAMRLSTPVHSFVWNWFHLLHCIVVFPKLPPHSSLGVVTAHAFHRRNGHSSRDQGRRKRKRRKNRTKDQRRRRRRTRTAYLHRSDPRSPYTHHDNNMSPSSPSNPSSPSLDHLVEFVECQVLRNGEYVVLEWNTFLRNLYCAFRASPKNADAEARLHHHWETELHPFLNRFANDIHALWEAAERMKRYGSSYGCHTTEGEEIDFFHDSIQSSVAPVFEKFASFLRSGCFFKTSRAGIKYRHS